MNYKSILAISASFFFFCMANAADSEQTMTVEWYKTHKIERVEKIAECKNNPGELSATPNCINAQKAANAITWSARGHTQLKPLTAEDLRKR